MSFFPQGNGCRCGGWCSNNCGYNNCCPPPCPPCPPVCPPVTIRIINPPPFPHPFPPCPHPWPLTQSNEVVDQSEQQQNQLPMDPQHRPLPLCPPCVPCCPPCCPPCPLFPPFPPFPPFQKANFTARFVRTAENLYETGDTIDPITTDYNNSEGIITLNSGLVILLPGLYKVLYAVTITGGEVEVNAEIGLRVGGVIDVASKAYATIDAGSTETLSNFAIVDVAIHTTQIVEIINIGEDSVNVAAVNIIVTKID